MSYTVAAPAAAAILNHPVQEKPLNQYALRVWTTRDGLPHNSVNRIAQSEEGYLWLATWEGPVRYNGRDFTLYDDIKVTRMPEAGALDIMVNAQNNHVIAAGPRGGLATFDGHTWTPNKVGSGYAFETVVDANNDIWSATGSGVYRIAATGTVQHYSQIQGLPDDAVFRLYRSPASEDQPAVIWAGTRQGLAYYHVQTDRFVPVESIPAAQVRAIRVMPNGVMVVASDNGLFYRTSATEDFKPWPQKVRGPITALSEGPEGCLWVGTFEYGLGRLCDNGQEWISVQDGLPNSHVLDIFRDREDNMWVSSHGGLVQLRKALFTSFTPNHGLKGAYVRSLNIDAEGVLWVGTNDGLSRQNENGFEVVEDDPLLKALSILSVAPGPNNELYIGSYTEGVLRLSEGRVTAQLNRDNGLSSNEVRVVKPLPNSNYILIGTPDGLFIAESLANEIKVLRRYTVADGMAADFVTAITVDDAGGLWVGSTASLSYFAATEKPFEWRPEAIDLASFTEARNIFAGTLHGNRIWLATAYGVITRSSSSNDWQWLSRANGLPFDKAFTINFDNEDNLWLGGSRGVVQIPQHDVQAWLKGELEVVSYKLFTEADGMVSRQLTTGGPASVVDTEGHIWFASALGAIEVNPTLLNEHEVVSPPAVIESVRSDTDTLAWNDTLAPSNTRISFRYVGLGYHMPEHIEYQVRLVGFDAHWMNRGGLLHTEYTALSPGSYTFAVRTRYPGGEWSQPTEFLFNKAAYFYQRPWFWFLFVLGIVTLVSIAVHLRIRGLQNTRMRLQAMVKEQTKELEALALQDSLTGLANRRAFDQQLAREAQHSARHQTPLTIALLDLDYFKKINDQFLHAGGDAILKQVAHLIATTVREVDHVARWGGEEFAIIFPQTTAEEAIHVLERIRAGIAAMTFSDVGQQARVTVSIGVMSGNHEMDSAQLLKHADRALYEAKNAGRNRIVRGCTTA